MKLLKKLFIPMLILVLAYLFSPQVKTWVTNTLNYIKSSSLYKKVLEMCTKPKQ